MSAPIAEIEDDWANFSEFSSPILCSNIKTNSNSNFSNEYHDGPAVDNYTHQNGIESYRSMEDLVHKFEEKVASCFKFSATPFNKDGMSMKPVRDFAELLVDNEIWKRITDNYGLVQPLDWINSRTRKLHIPALELSFNSKESGDINGNSKSEEDMNTLQKEMDLHRLIEYNVYTEMNATELSPSIKLDGRYKDVQTADEVIQELEEIMLDAEEQDAAFDDELQQQTGIIIGDNDSIGLYSSDTDFTSDESSVLHGGRALGSPSSQDESDRATVLKSMSINELSEELNNMDQTVKLLSEDLLNQLNLRDEMLYGKEVRNAFISKVLEVQYKQEQFQQNSKAHIGRYRFGKLSKSFSTSNTAAPGRFLTSVIPYEDGAAPTLEDLQALIKILNAIKEDSDEVPSLLTNYILKVLCPADAHTLSW